MKILLAGCGALGAKLGCQLQENGNEVIGLKRQLSVMDFPLITIDLSDKEAVMALPKDVDMVVFTVTPSDYSVQGYRQVYQTILGNIIDYVSACERMPLLLLVSSTGVYGQDSGQWVNEDSETQPVSDSGRCILAGEKLLRSRWHHHIIVRFSGIYGVGRLALIKKAISGEAIQQKPTQWTNRIHEADCIGALNFLISCYQQGKPLSKLYLISDDEPVGRYEVAAFICRQLGKALPAVKQEKLSLAANKRCDNSRFKALGYTFQYSDYRQGYQSVMTVLDMTCF